MTTRLRTPLLLGLTAVLLATLPSCADDDEPTTAGTPPPSAAPRNPAEINSQEYRPTIDPARFTTRIDNPFMPLEPGSRRVYENRAGRNRERITIDVTRDTRVVMGVTTVVVHDKVTRGDKTIEDTYDWFAQDSDGNVWYFGEDTTAYEGGKANKEGSWEAGKDGAQPGIVMLAQPAVGDRYRQEYLKGEAEDQGEVLGLDDKAEVPYGSYTGVLKTKDTTPLEPDLVEHKYYARGVGVVLEEEIAGGSDRVVLLEVSTQ